MRKLTFKFTKLGTEDTYEYDVTVPEHKVKMIVHKVDRGDPPEKLANLDEHSRRILKQFPPDSVLFVILGNDQSFEVWEEL